MFLTPARIFEALGQWPYRSQQGSRRNALIASTSLAERRREADEVDEFLARRVAAREAAPTTLEVPVRSSATASGRKDRPA